MSKFGKVVLALGVVGGGILVAVGAWPLGVGLFGMTLLCLAIGE